MERQPDPEPDELQLLIRLASESPRATTRTKGKKLAALADEIRRLVKDEAEERERTKREAAQREAALAEVKALEEKLAVAREKAGVKLSSKYVATGTGVGAYQAQVLARTGATAAEVREWARGAGHDPKPTGVIARKILDAFEAARP